MPDKDEQTKEVVKEALREWLDEKYAEFGKWTLHGLIAAALVGLVYFIVWTEYLKK